MPHPPIATRPARASDRDVVIDILARAFVDDPALSWLFRDSATRPQRLRRFFALITAADARPADWTLALDAGNRPVAAALWRPPGHWAIPRTAMARNILPLLATFGTGLPRALAMQAQIDSHHAAAPHWYLQFAGCLPAAQGKGYGGAAIRDRLALCDAHHQPAALETATPANLGLYQALGFAISDDYRIKADRAGPGPQFWTMWRA